MLNSIFVDEIPKDYVIATYYVMSERSLRSAAYEIALGQTIGNPGVRNKYETRELVDAYCAVIENSDNLNNKAGMVKVGFPPSLFNIDSDGVSQMICILMGGQVDISNILVCRLEGLYLPESIKSKFKGPKYGITGLRDFCQVYDRPLIGSIIKPKVGLNPSQLLDMVKQLVDGGINFIKEDEILGDQAFCPLEERTALLGPYLSDKKVVYCAAINCDPLQLKNKLDICVKNGINGVHINVWSGLGSYKSIRDLDLPLFIHFQKSGDKCFTAKESKYSISWNVICQLATLSGVDTIHTGMFGGYSSDTKEDLEASLQILREGNTMPALSCGLHPGLIPSLVELFGTDFLANAGGSIHGHPGGTTSGVKAMYQSVNSLQGEELNQAIEKWGNGL